MNDGHAGEKVGHQGPTSSLQTRRQSIHTTLTLIQNQMETDK